MKVIVAGFPKTGTKSMNAALTILGYKVYDAPDSMILLENEYTRILKDGWDTEDFRRMYEDVDAVMDIPACNFWEELHKAFPDAKIILTMRNDEDEWYRSFENQLRMQESHMVLKLYPLSKFLSPSFRRIRKNAVDPASKRDA